MNKIRKFKVVKIEDFGGDYPIYDFPNDLKENEKYIGKVGLLEEIIDNGGSYEIDGETGNDDGYIIKFDDGVRGNFDLLEIEEVTEVEKPYDKIEEACKKYGYYHGDK
jgi:hypothetical protein